MEKSRNRVLNTDLAKTLCQRIDMQGHNICWISCYMYKQKKQL